MSIGTTRKCMLLPILLITQAAAPPPFFAALLLRMAQAMVAAPAVPAAVVDVHLNYTVT